MTRRRWAGLAVLAVAIAAGGVLLIPHRMKGYSDVLYFVPVRATIRLVSESTGLPVEGAQVYVAQSKDDLTSSERRAEIAERASDAKSRGRDDAGFGRTNTDGVASIDLEVRMCARMNSAYTSADLPPIELDDITGVWIEAPGIEPRLLESSKARLTVAPSGKGPAHLEFGTVGVR